MLRAGYTSSPEDPVKGLRSPYLEDLPLQWEENTPKTGG